MIGEFDPDVIGISGLFSNLMESAHHLAAIAKRVQPHAPIILGGNHLSNAISDYQYAASTPDSNLSARFRDLEDDNIDYAMRGEVDLEFPKLVGRLLEGRDVTDIPGLVRRQGSGRNDHVNRHVRTYFLDHGLSGRNLRRYDANCGIRMASGADNFSFAILSPLPGTPIYRQVMRENLWWPRRDIRDLMFRSSLVKVDGFDSPEQFEQFVTETHVKANRLLQKQDPERFKTKYGADTSERMLVKQS